MEAKKSKLDVVAVLNPLIFHQRFQHVTEQTIAKLDKKSLKTLREVSKSWQEYIDNKSILWNEVFKKR